VEPLDNRGMLSVDRRKLEYLFSRVTGLRRQVVSSLFGFNLLSKEDASL